MTFHDWNNSALSLLQRCGEAFRRRYIEGDIIPPSPRMLRGTVVHSVATTAMLRKLDEDELPSVEEAKDLAASAFDLTWKAGVTLSEDEQAVGVRSVAGVSKDFAIDLSAFHVERVAPGIHPVAVERKIEVRPKDSDLIIHGTIDLVEGCPDGTEVIHDLKTTEKSPSKGTADESQQLTYYAWLRQLEVGALPASVVLDYLVRTPARAEKKHVVLTSTRTKEDVSALIHRLNMAVEAVQKGVFVPAAPDSWQCSKDWCGYWDTCPYVNHGRTRATS